MAGTGTKSAKNHQTSQQLHRSSGGGSSHRSDGAVADYAVISDSITHKPKKFVKQKAIKFEKSEISFAAKIGLWMMGTSVSKMDKVQKAEKRKRDAERERKSLKRSNSV